MGPVPRARLHLRVVLQPRAGRSAVRAGAAGVVRGPGTGGRRGLERNLRPGRNPDRLRESRGPSRCPRSPSRRRHTPYVSPGAPRSSATSIRIPGSSTQEAAAEAVEAAGCVAIIHVRAFGLCRDVSRGRGLGRSSWRASDPGFGGSVRRANRGWPRTGRRGRGRGVLLPRHEAVRHRRGGSCLRATVDCPASPRGDQFRPRAGRAERPGPECQDERVHGRGRTRHARGLRCRSSDTAGRPAHA